MSAPSFRCRGLITASLHVAEIPLSLIVARYDPAHTVPGSPSSMEAGSAIANPATDRVLGGCGNVYRGTRWLVESLSGKYEHQTWKAQKMLGDVSSSLELPRASSRSTQFHLHTDLQYRTGLRGILHRPSLLCHGYCSV